MIDRLRGQQDAAAQLIADLSACVDVLEAESEQFTKRVETLEWHLRECVNQLEYQHEKFGGTGSGDTVMFRARAALEDNGNA